MIIPALIAALAAAPDTAKLPVILFASSNDVAETMNRLVATGPREESAAPRYFAPRGGEPIGNLVLQAAPFVLASYPQCRLNPNTRVEYAMARTVGGYRLVFRFGAGRDSKLCPEWAGVELGDDGSKELKAFPHEPAPTR